MKYTIIALICPLFIANGIGQNIIIDADGDTSVDTESVSDADSILFTLGGTTQFVMNGPRIEVVNSGRSVFLGFEAGLNDDLSSNQNVAIGDIAMRSMISGVQNVVIGEAALLANSSGSRNIAIGQSALRTNNSGSNNVAIGEEALYFSQGSGVVAVGKEAGENSGSGGVYLGHQAGMLELGNDRLYIDNSDTNSPLIYGEFDNDKIVINGTYEVSSDKRLKSKIKKIENVLPKLMQLNGYSYNRKSVADKSKREIGVIAQEILEVYPDAVGENNDGLLSVNYLSLSAVL